MTWTFVMASGRKGIQLSLLASLLFVAGCEGSRLGSNLGKSLEPDPQLAGESPASEGASSGTVSVEPANTSNSRQPTDEADKETVETDGKTTEETEPAIVAGDYSDIDKAPEEIQPYLVDLIELGLLEVRAPKTPAPAPVAENSSSDNPTPAPAAKPAPPAADEFRPNQAMTRREYARWLLAVNNKFYAGERTRKIRPGVESAQPVFQDVPVTDPDFGSIQGLAEAGMIPSPLTGSSTTITFRPEAPLTRKDLLLWKVPLDTRQPLPEASVSAVQQAWGFQDAGKIEPRALQAVLADYQNGDFANIRRAFNYTTLFQPDKAATRAEGSAVLWRFGNSTEGVSAAEVRNPNSNSSNNNRPNNTTEENTPTDG